MGQISGVQSMSGMAQDAPWVKYGKKQKKPEEGEFLCIIINSRWSVNCLW